MGSVMEDINSFTDNLKEKNSFEKTYLFKIIALTALWERGFNHPR